MPAERDLRQADMTTLYSPAGGLRALSLVMGLFLVLMGYGKLAWFADSAHLTYELEQWLSFEPVPISRWYIEWVAMPGAPLFARLVVLGRARRRPGADRRVPGGPDGDGGARHGAQLPFRQRHHVHVRLSHQRLRAARHRRTGRPRHRRRSSGCRTAFPGSVAPGRRGLARMVSHRSLEDGRGRLQPQVAGVRLQGGILVTAGGETTSTNR